MKKILIWVIVVFIICFGLVYFLNKNKQVISNLDGLNSTSTINLGGEGSPDNKFVIPENWLATSSAQFSYSYPADLGTKYINPVDWPPVLNISPEPFSCLEAGRETDRAGVTSKETSVNGDIYCVTKKSEGAAGSVYTSYAYTFSKDNQTFIFTFTLRAPQCMNYDEPKQSECTKEEADFDMINTMDIIQRSLQNI